MPNKDASQAYQKLHYQLYFFTFIFDLVLLGIFFLSGASFVLRQWITSFTDNAILINGSYFIIFSVAAYLIHWPISFFSGFIWEHRFKLSNQTFSQWMWDQLKGGLLGLLLGLILVEVIYVFLARFTETWWIWAASFWLLLSYVLAKITPNVIIPLFYKYKPLNNSSLRSRILKLFDSCHVPLKDVYAIDMSAKTKKANAFLCGIGRQRRVVLSDTLLNAFSDDEVEVVVAHELAHLKHADIIKMLFIQALVIFVGLFLVAQMLKKALIVYELKGIDDIAFLPGILFIFMIFSFILQPILNGYSRIMERAADRFSLERTLNVQAFISLMTKLGKMNLSENSPSPLIEMLLYDHPSIHRRIDAAREFLRKK